MARLPAPRPVPPAGALDPWACPLHSRCLETPGDPAVAVFPTASRLRTPLLPEGSLSARNRLTDAASWPQTLRVCVLCWEPSRHAAQKGRRAEGEPGAGRSCPRGHLQQGCCAVQASILWEPVIRGAWVTGAEASSTAGPLSGCSASCPRGWPEGPCALWAPPEEGLSAAFPRLPSQVCGAVGRVVARAHPHPFLAALSPHSSPI